MNIPRHWARGKVSAKDDSTDLVHETTAFGWSDISIAAITRNRYGTLVLNTATVAFIDVDLSRPRFFQRLIARIHGRQATTEGDVIERTTKLLDAFGSDPRYRVLCRVQRSFRARRSFRSSITTRKLASRSGNGSTSKRAPTSRSANLSRPAARVRPIRWQRRSCGNTI